MTFHWEFTLGSDRVAELVESICPLQRLARTSLTLEWDEPTELFPPYKMFERGGTKIAVIGQAFPYMPIANPRWMFPEYSFGIRDENMAADGRRGPRRRVRNVSWCSVTTALMSTKKWPVWCRASTLFCQVTPMMRCPNRLLVGQHHHPALRLKRQICHPLPIWTFATGKMMGYRTKLIPIFSDVITPDAEIVGADRRTARALMRRNLVRGHRPSGQHCCIGVATLTALGTT